MTKRISRWLFLVALISAAHLCIGWGKKVKTTEDFLRIAACGAGLVIDANGKDPTELMKIAAIYGNAAGTLYLKNCDGFETTDLMRIAACGNGHVVIEL